MKLNLTMVAPEEIGGFKNIDHVIDGSVANLDPWVADSECQEIVAIDVIDFFYAADIDAVIDNWIKKLHHGGIITIGGVDLAEVARRIHIGQLNLDQANLMIYGPQNAPWASRKSSTSIQHIDHALTSRGLKTLRRVLSNSFYQVTAERP